MKGESRIAAPRPSVWHALNDPEVLARCIDGVEALALMKDDDGTTRLDGKLNAKVGPVRATFSGTVRLTEVDAPNRYVLIGEGRGGVAGFAKGTAEITLVDVEGDGTLLQYTVASSVGGKLAQLGARLIEGTARGYADTFFTRLKAEVEQPMAETDAAAAAQLPAPGDPVADPQKLHAVGGRTGLTPLVWSGVVIVIVLAVLLWQLT